MPCDFSDSDGNRENISEVDDEIAVLVSDSAYIECEKFEGF